MKPRPKRKAESDSLITRSLNVQKIKPSEINFFQHWASPTSRKLNQIKAQEQLSLDTQDMGRPEDHNDSVVIAN